MKTIKDLTPEIESRIPWYIENATKDVFNGNYYKNFDLEKAKKAVYYNYENCGFKRPLVLVAGNPYEAQLMFNFIKNTEWLKLINLLFYNNKITDSQLENQLDSKSRNKLDSKLRNKLLSELGEQLDSQFESQLYSHLNIQLGRLLRIQLEDQLDSHIGIQLGRLLRNKSESQLDSKLSGQLSTQLYSQLRSKLSKQLISQLDIKLRSKLCDQLYSQLDRLLHSQLDTQLYSQLSSKLQEYNCNYLYTLNVYSNAHYNWFEFIRKEFNINLSINDKFQEYFKLQRESGIYNAIFSEQLCIVSKYPKKIKRDGIKLHSTDSASVEWDCFSEFTNFDIYCINGRNISKENFEKVSNEKLTFNDFIKLENEDEKAAIITMIKEKFGSNRLISFLNAEIIDEQVITHSSGHSETLRLYKTKEKMDFLADENNNKGEYMAWFEETCPSTGQVYLLDTLPKFTDVIEAAKFHRPGLVPSDIEYNFINFNN